MHFAQSRDELDAINGGYIYESGIKSHHRNKVRNSIPTNDQLLIKEPHTILSFIFILFSGTIFWFICVFFPFYLIIRIIGYFLGFPFFPLF